MSDDLPALEAAFSRASYDRRSDAAWRALAPALAPVQRAPVTHPFDGWWFWAGFAIGLGTGLMIAAYVDWRGDNHD